MATSNSSAGASASTSASAPSSRQTIQLQKNLESLKNNPLPFVRDLELRAGEAGNEMTGTMIGPENTPYAGRDLEFIIKFVPEYPFKQPLVHFLTAISHPNVSKKDGFACHDQMMSQWKPKISLSEVLTNIYSLLEKPNYDVPVQDNILVKNESTNSS